MLRVLAFLVLLTGTIATSIGRANAQLGQFPYIVSLRFYGSHTCSGSILDSKHILTAASCMKERSYEPSTFSIQYGVVDNLIEDDIIAVKEMVFHPNYTTMPSQKYKNDIVVLYLDRRLQIGVTAQKTALPHKNDITPPNTTAVLAGWGYDWPEGNQNRYLQYVNIKSFSYANCENLYRGKVLKEMHICAGIPEGGKGICHGDIGSPLYVRGIQVGILSFFGYPCTAEYPAVYTLLPRYVEWIKSVL